MHLGVMSKNLVKLANDIDNIVDGFLSTAQYGGTSRAKGAVNVVLADSKAEGLKTWNDMLQKLSDEDYERALQCERVDVDVKMVLTKSGYKITMVADPAPPMPDSVITYLQPFLNGVAGKAKIKADATLKDDKNAKSEEWEYYQYLCFRNCT